MKITIEELASIVNNECKKNINLSVDGRVKELSERRIRDYISKNLLHKGFKDGKYTYYDQSHIDKLIMLRQLQDEGIQEKTLQKLNSSIDKTNIFENDINRTNETKEKENLISVLSSIQNRNNITAGVSCGVSLNNVKNLNLKEANLKYEIKNKKEYVISENISLFVEGNINKEQQDEALKNLIELFKNKL